MCLAIPGKLISVWDDGGVKLGTALFGGEQRDVNLTFVPDAGPGDHVVVHSGFAVSLLGEEEAAAVAALQSEAFETSQD